ncbi:ABC-type multidrug transport system, ATPase component [Thioalkalivibrio nitratireducens DSM 14787]|uniref:ABC-type multidrug transport system, ATPase component n=1 Tax=Thioalkalivibrio nitratireducens (strain DSM 14787 / UNIQEM 213 / ALEN2) TaxID=1255043 RepID=L0DXU5_THIND|nr:ABC transporter ATP-binding protein [Thioalkalivibrio nitratireducens]AGA33201.1 ABC-type multidrug transport system, ATPase component [Thioalkalivibrio nitratireducens DSM 14787]
MTAALEIRGLRKTYRNGFEALKGIDLTVAPGSFFALLGPNGAGKSTTIGIITSLINKTAGTVRVFGHDLDRELQEIKRSIGVVPQEFNFNTFEPVGEIVVNQAGYYGITRRDAWRRAQHYLGELGLWDKRRDMARTLSGGMKRRLMIARALVHEPRLLILDEPTAGVDIELRRSMWEFLQDVNRDGRSIILTTHYLEEAERLCRSIAIIDHGCIVENTTMKALLAQLDTETVILDLQAPADRLPRHSGIPLRAIDALTLEADIHRGESLNNLFQLLDQEGIQVQSMRNKSNRLEELFIRMTQAGNGRLQDAEGSAP